MSLLIVVSLASALFQSPAGAGGTSLSGVVVAEDGRTPLPGVEVTLIAVDERPLRGSAYKAVTDADGRYRLERLQAGRYHVTVQKAGYARLDAPEIPEVFLSAGVTREPLNFTLQKGAVIVGRVLDDDGDPVLDAQVIALRRPPAHLSDVARRSQLPFLPAGQMASTNDLGEFRIFGLPPHDEYFVNAVPPPDFGRVSTASTVLIPAFFPGAPDSIAAQPVAVGAGQTSADVVIRMIFRPRTVARESRQASATSLPVLRWRNVNVSSTTGMEVWNLTPAPSSCSHVARARPCRGSRVSASAIQAPVSTKTSSPARTVCRCLETDPTARRRCGRGRRTCVTACRSTKPPAPARPVGARHGGWLHGRDPQRCVPTAPRRREGR